MVGSLQSTPKGLTAPGTLFLGFMFGQEGGGVQKKVGFVLSSEHLLSLREAVSVISASRAPGIFANQAYQWFIQEKHSQGFRSPRKYFKQAAYSQQTFFLALSHIFSFNILLNIRLYSVENRKFLFSLLDIGPQDQAQAAAMSYISVR